MDDFITLTCPNCGGKLEVIQETNSLVCQHCGTEHILRQKFSEGKATARSVCPVCKKEDRVARVAEALDYLPDGTRKKFNPPLPPEQPQMTPKLLLGEWIVLGIFALMSDLLATFYIGNALEIGTIGEDPFALLWGGLIFILLGVLAFGIIWIITRIVQQNEKKRYSAALREWAKERRKWEKAIRRWESCYYCARDTIIFDPNTNQTYPLDRFDEYLWS